MPRNLRRYQGQGDLHFITFSCYERRALLGTVFARDLFLKILEEARKQFGSSVVGYVVMPEHVHLLIGEPKQGTLARLLQVLKQRVSLEMRGTHKANGQSRLEASNISHGLLRFWQRRYYDFNVYSSEKMREKLEYMHDNPLKRRLVQDLEDWPWSSWRFYIKREAGIVRIEPMG